MQLDGVRILDLTQLLPGPYATQLLADMGADIIKVEPPGGDPARGSPPLSPDGDSVIFAAVNDGKRSITLDLKTDAGLEAFHTLAADADAIVEQYRPGVVDRLGVDYDTVAEYNEDVVYCSLTGYGQTGPNRDRVGHDINYVGAAGLLDMTRGSADGDPVIPGYPIADMAGGLFAALAVLGSLLSRELGDQQGEYLDVAMTDAVLSLSQIVTSEVLGDGDPRPSETELTGKYPCYDVYETADGEYVTLAALEHRFWEAFCEAVDKPQLVDRHKADSAEARATVRSELADTFAARTRAEWESMLSDRDVMVAPVRSPVEALADDHVRARDLLDDVDEAIRRIGFPVRCDVGPDGGTGGVPDFGEHTAAVLEDAGLGDDEVRALAGDD